ncbi:patatin-like phospholipase family protein [Kitasatospora sp. NPDC097643]|uniref:patatin-like phospholipase family protein n=1 Tax=Kitasatospora sp. NPDC097643 TaxID=3157230 RepID=UPI0033265618
MTSTEPRATEPQATALPATALPSTGRALVLGPGGYAGTAWTAGLVAGLREAGIDLADADLIVGTSGGAIVGALLATGQDPRRLADPLPADALPAGPTRATAPRRPDPALTGAVHAVLGDRTLTPQEARRRVGRLALDAADPHDPRTHEAQQTLLAHRRALIGADTWPRRRLLLTAVQAETGEPAVWDRTSGVPLVHAVAASSAFPGVEPPVAVDGHHYLDGALRAGVNADLATGARTLVVIAPLAHRFPREELDRQLAATGAPITIAVTPDPASITALDAPPHDPTTWPTAYLAGHRQATHTAPHLHPTWP